MARSIAWLSLDRSKALLDGHPDVYGLYGRQLCEDGDKGKLLAPSKQRITLGTPINHRSGPRGP